MKKIARFSAFTTSCIIMAASMASCAEGDTTSNFSGGNYHETSAYSESADSSYCEAVESKDSECEPTEVNVPSANEEYKGYIESGFKDPNAEPLSTFSADVDTASYTNMRRLIEDNTFVPEDSVRIEEFINYFDYDYPQPEDGTAFGRYAEITDCPWNSSHKLMMLGIQGKELEQKETPPSNIVFLIDSSGSMSSYDKLPLVQSAFSMLAENLTENDRISIVTYAGSSETVISGVRGSEKDTILEALYSLRASGSTNGEGGINSAYELAEEYFIEGGNNRVILATDGDLNVGASSESELVELIEEKRDRGIYLSVLGFGTGNYKDARLEAVADNGNGNFSYIDSIEEAQRVLVNEMSGTLYTIAKDVKIQVEFNPSTVKSYRLIGYDNRLMAAEDFYDDRKDAGEVGSGHSVTALYEIEVADENGSYHGIPLEFASEHTEDTLTADGGRTELCKVSIAYKDIDTNETIRTSDLFGMEKYDPSPSRSMKIAGTVAEFAMLLKNSEYMGNSSFDYVLENTKSLYKDADEKVAEFCDLADKAYNIYY
ncbi:MAG: VWA domain-containing protein [Ruminococcus sp.]|nr:VWA domain-containing protein [Ruminococcus sp.]